MRIAYLAPYQGTELLWRRPTLANLALAANLKIELVAELLVKAGFQVEIISQGEVVERRAKFYRGFDEAEPFHSQIPVHYAAALPIRFLNGLTSAVWTVLVLLRRQLASKFDVVIVYNLKPAQLLTALVARFLLRLPVILEHEDDVFVEVSGRANAGIRVGLHRKLSRLVLRNISGSIGASPHLLSRAPREVPSLLLRGVVSEAIIARCNGGTGKRENWAVYSGTLFRSKGLEQLISAWESNPPQGWELHIAGDGEKAELVREAARRNPGIVYHGLLDRNQNAELLSRAAIGMNAHDLSATPGNVFAFKIIEYLAAGLHVITTPMGPLEPELEAGITYIPDNKPETIGASLKRVIETRALERTASGAAQERYGPEPLTRRLGEMFRRVVDMPGRSAKDGQTG